MRSHRELWKRVQRALTGEELGRTVTGLVLAELDRWATGSPALWSDSELERLKRPIVRDSRARRAYVRAITDGCKARGIEPPPLDELDPPSEPLLVVLMRVFLLDHQDTAVPASLPEQAYPAYAAWRATMHAPAMDLATFTRHFLEQRRSLRWHLKGLHPIVNQAGSIIAPAMVDP
jgi:hypothetical protein